MNEVLPVYYYWHYTRTNVLYGEVLTYNHAPPNRPKNKCTLVTPSRDLFFTCRGEKYTVLIQFCTEYTVIDEWVFKGKKVYLE